MEYLSLTMIMWTTFQKYMNFYTKMLAYFFRTIIRIIFNWFKSQIPRKSEEFSLILVIFSFSMSIFPTAWLDLSTPWPCSSLVCSKKLQNGKSDYFLWNLEPSLEFNSHPMWTRYPQWWMPLLLHYLITRSYLLPLECHNEKGPGREDKLHEPIPAHGMFILHGNGNRTGV